MAAKTSILVKRSTENKADCQEETAEGAILDADYSEDRPVSVLAAQQREFQKSRRGQYRDTEMPLA